MAVSTHKSIGVSNRGTVFFCSPNGLCQVFEVYLMTNTGTWRHHPEVGECPPDSVSDTTSDVSRCARDIRSNVTRYIRDI